MAGESRIGTVKLTSPQKLAGESMRNQSTWSCMCPHPSLLKAPGNWQVSLGGTGW